MPIICMFYGIKIYIYPAEHLPPHFYAVFGDDEISVDIRDLEITKGSLPRKKEKMVLKWAALHQKELMENWELLKAENKPFLIKPLP